jgi:hypothetical protein
LQGDGTQLLRYLHGRLPGSALVFQLSFDVARFAAMTELPPEWHGQLELSSRSGVRDGPVVRMAPVFTDGVVHRGGVAGIVSVYLDDLLAHGGQDVCYVTAFTARRLHWLYYLINRSQVRLKNPVIRDRQDFIFDGPEKIMLPEGEPALCFSSGAAVFPLRQKPVLVFDLMARLGDQEWAPDTEHCLISGLPAPAVGQLDMKWVAEKPYVFSAMHVYL